MTSPRISCSDNIELIIFDCDGVLVDSEILSQRVLLNMLKKLGVDVSADYFYQHFLGYSFEHVTKKILDDFSVKLTNEFRYEYRDALKSVFSSELEPTNNLMWLLSHLDVETCIATSGSPEKVKNSLCSTKLASYFLDRVFTSSEVENGKPAPDLFLHAAKKMGISHKNCLVIEDSYTGVKAALAANMNVVHYTGASHMTSRNTDNFQLLGSIETIQRWDQLFIKYPALSSSLKIER